MRKQLWRRRPAELLLPSVYLNINLEGLTIVLPTRKYCNAELPIWPLKSKLCASPLTQRARRVPLYPNYFGKKTNRFDQSKWNFLIFKIVFLESRQFELKLKARLRRSVSMKRHVECSRRSVRFVVPKIVVSSSAALSLTEKIFYISAIKSRILTGMQFGLRCG